MISVFCSLNGKMVQLEVSVSTHYALREAVVVFNLPTQNILAPAFKKYGVRESSILKYIEKDLKKERR